MRIALNFSIFYAICSLVTGELYSALAGLETLLDTQMAIIDTLDSYIEMIERKTEKLRKLKENYMYLHKASSVNFVDFVSNPINAFVLMKRLTLDWVDTKELSTFSPIQDIRMQNVVFPDDNDLNGAAKALLRVQQTYDLDTYQLSKGKISGAPSGLFLSADDCFEMGRQAFHSGYYENAISWLEIAKSKWNESDEDARNSSEVSKYLTMSTYEKGRSSIMLLTNSLLQLSFMMAPSLENSLNPNSLSLQKADSNNDFMSQTTFFDEATYRQLCQSSMQVISPVYSSQLRCNLLSHHPYFLLQPIKEEKLWVEPRISLFHDVISDKEIELMKSLALPALQRAEVAEYSGSLGHRVSDTRVTKIAWLREEDHPLIPKMYHRIEGITGLSSSSAEPFQMANYGLGGHFHLHMDVLPDTESYFGPNLGNRIATWLTYLSDVHGGGATVFPRLNITVWPKKGSALFWHNVKSNGVGNILTLHGACPVVTGSKWVTNVWFHERGQEFKLKCGMHPEAALQPIDSFKKR